MNTSIESGYSPGWVERHCRALMCGLGAMLLLGAIALQWLDYHACQSNGACDTMARLDAAWDAEAFERAVWRASSHPSGDAPTLRPGEPVAAVVSLSSLREMLFVDSLVLVPSYAGLLLLYVVVLHHLAFPPMCQNRERTPNLDAREWSLQLACLTVVIAAVFGIAKNGITIRAAEDALERLLADPTVDDVHLAASLNWLFIAMAVLVAGVLGLKASARLQRRGRRHWLVGGCLLAACAGLYLAYRAMHPDEFLTGAGVRLLAVSLVVLGVPLWWLDPAMRTPRSATNQ